jgi:hypothetical protein
MPLLRHLLYAFYSIQLFPALFGIIIIIVATTPMCYYYCYCYYCYYYYMSSLGVTQDIKYTIIFMPCQIDSLIFTTRTIVKELRGKGADWDYYLNYCQYAMNCKYARLHKSRPYTVLFNRQPNGFEDYSNTKPVLQLEETDTKMIDEKFKFVNEVVIPALSKRIRDTQERDHDRFVKTHRIVTKQFPVGSKVMIKNVTRLSKLDARNLGPFYIHGITKNGSYILKDKAGTLLSRDVPTSHIIFISSDNISTEEYQKLKEDHFEIQAVIDHSGSPGNYLYRVKWKGYPNDEDDTWEPPSHFDSKKPIEIYWGRRNADHKQSSSKKRKAPMTVNTRKIATRNKRSRNQQ